MFERNYFVVGRLKNTTSTSKTGVYDIIVVPTNSEGIDDKNAI